MPDPRAQILDCATVSEWAAAFVLGSLEPDEMAAVRDHFATCPDPHVEVEALGAAVQALATVVPLVAPPAGLGARILKAARAEAAMAAAVSAETPTVAAVPPRAQATERTKPEPTPWAMAPVSVPFGTRLGARLRQPAWVVAAVAVVLAVAVGTQTLQLQGQVGELTAYRQAVGQVMDAAASKGSRLAVLAPAAASAQGLAAVTADGRLLVAMRNLAPTSGSEVYEVWVIAGGGAPVAAGSFQVGSSGVGGLAVATASLSGTVTVALTREPTAGRTTPTLPVLVQGQAQVASG